MVRAPLGLVHGTENGAKKMKKMKKMQKVPRSEQSSESLIVKSLSLSESLSFKMSISDISEFR